MRRVQLDGEEKIERVTLDGKDHEDLLALHRRIGALWPSLPWAGGPLGAF